MTSVIRLFWVKVASFVLTSTVPDFQPRQDRKPVENHGLSIGPSSEWFMLEFRRDHRETLAQPPILALGHPRVDILEISGIEENKHLWLGPTRQVATKAHAIRVAILHGLRASA